MYSEILVNTCAYTDLLIHFSSIIENKLSVGSLNGAVEVFEQLCAISRELEGSRCVQLVSFVGHWCEQHRHQLKERLTR